MNRKVERQPRLRSPEHNSKDNTDLKIVYCQIDTLKPDPSNPRRHTKKQNRQIADSIEIFDFNVPILTDGERNIVVGHGRFFACRLLGKTEVPTLCLDHLTPEQARAFRIADNRLTEISTWDDRLLAEQLKELSVHGLDFNIEATGFEMGEIDLRIASLEEPPGREDDPADVVLEVSAGPALSRNGDLWILDRHRLLCGSALETPAFAALMGEEQAAMGFTDPPYNVAIEGHASGLGATHHRPFPMASGEMDSTEFTAFLSEALRNLAACSVDGSIHFVCMDWRHVEELLGAGRAVYSELKNLCVWVKDNAGMGSLYRSQHELILVFKNGKAPHRNNVELGQHGRNRTNVWHYPHVGNFGRIGEEGNLAALHPTVKPVGLIAHAILDCSARGDVVLDPFLGSGSTLIAAERVGRICRGIELDPHYVDTAIRRGQYFNVERAVLAAAGIRLDELAAEEGCHGQGG